MAEDPLTYFIPDTMKKTFVDGSEYFTTLEINPDTQNVGQKLNELASQLQVNTKFANLDTKYALIRGNWNIARHQIDGINLILESQYRIIDDATQLLEDLNIKLAAAKERETICKKSGCKLSGYTGPAKCKCWEEPRKLNGEITSIKSREEVAKKQISKYNPQLEPLTNKIKNYVNEISKLELEYREECRRVAKILVDKRNLNLKLQEAIDQCRKKETSFNELNARLKHAEKALSDFRASRIGPHLNALDVARAERAKLDSDYKLSTEFLKKLQKDRSAACKTGAELSSEQLAAFGTGKAPCDACIAGTTSHAACAAGAGDACIGRGEACDVCASKIGASCMRASAAIAAAQHRTNNMEKYKKKRVKELDIIIPTLEANLTRAQAEVEPAAEALIKECEILAPEVDTARVAHETAQATVKQLRADLLRLT
jgi:chromosome segregation ATPase